MIVCDEASCVHKVSVYRQCADLACKRELGYCASHGGDERAQREMAAHIDEHRSKAVSPSR